MTGTNADVRTMVNPSDEGKVAAGIFAAVKGSSVSNLDEKTCARVQEAAKSLNCSSLESQSFLLDQTT